MRMQPKNREIRCDPSLSLLFENQSKHDDAVRADDVYAYFYVYVYGCDVRHHVQAVSDDSVVSVVSIVSNRVGSDREVQYIRSAMALFSTVIPFEKPENRLQHVHEYGLSRETDI
jgi:hypothetical protein